MANSAMPTPPAAPVMPPKPAVLPPKTRRATPLWSIIGTVVLIVAVGGLGYMWWNAEQRASSAAHDLSVAEQRASSAAANTNAPGAIALPADFRTIMSITSTEDMKFEYRCRGDVRQGNMEDADTSYCIGIYKLVLVTPLGEKTLETGYAESPANAPYGMTAEYKSYARGSARVIISFAAGGCRLDNDLCGAGGPDNLITGNYNMELGAYMPLLGAYMPLRNFPTNGTPIWSAQGTQALFLPRTCGGAGCMAAPIRVYNIETDTVRDLTTETAAEEPNAEDVSGAKLPYWKNLHWSGPNEFEVTLVGVDGRERTVGGVAAY